jgi:hypothetical protein
MFDLTIEVYDVDREELAKIRNAVLQKIEVTTDFQMSINERSEANANST